MSEPRSFMALDWVKGEIEDTLNRAREALEAFVETPDDTTLARQCLTSLHQVHGTLQMVELSGAATLASEMEALAQALMNQAVVDEERAHEALMEGILQLPAHLNRVHRGGDDDARIHTLLMDRMRVARGEEPLARTEDLAVDPAVVAKFMAGNGPVEVRKVRGPFQKAMIALLRGTQPPAKMYQFFDKAFTRLELLTPASPLKRLWSLAAGAMEIRTATGEEPRTVMPLLRALDQQLKDLADSTEAALSAEVPAALSDGLRVIVENATVDSPRLSALRQRLAGGDEPPSAQPIGADDETIAMVATALHEELGGIRDRLDLFVRGSISDTESLASLGADLQRIAGTLQVAGLDDLREAIARQAAWIKQQAGAGMIDEDAIMDVASAVLFVDGALMGLAGIESDASGAMPGSLSDAQTAVLREARASLDAVKQGIVDFIASDWEHSHLEPLPGILVGVRSVLELVPLEKAAGLVEGARVYVEEEVLKPLLVPEWQRLDSLADAITSIDYFLERMIEDRVIPDPRLLEIAEESIEQLKSASTGMAPGVQSFAAITQDDLDATGVRAPEEMPELAVVEVVEEAAPADPVPEQQPDAEEQQAPAAAEPDELEVLGLEPLTEPPAAVDDAFDLSEPGTEAPVSGQGAGDAVSELAPPVEDEFDLSEPGTETPVSGLDEAASELAPPVEDEFDLSEPGAETPISGLDADDAASGLPTPVEDDFDLGEAEPTFEFEAGVDPAADADAPLEDDFDLGGAVEPPALEPDVAPPAAVEAAPEATPETEPELAPVPASDAAFETADAGDESESLIDDEILEIFLEEVVEVLESIDGALPTWRAQPTDAESMGDIRRGYHTLKGSGRMVGATVLAELAWSVENMLNRVIDGTIEASEAVVELVQQVRDTMPELREAFAEGREPDVDVSAWMERADLLASGGSAADLLELPAPGGGAATSRDDSPSGLSAPVEDDFDLGEEIELSTPVGAPVDDGPSALSTPVEEDFDLGLDADSEAPLDVTEEISALPLAAPEDPLIQTAEDPPSVLSAPVEDDFDLSGEFETEVPAVEDAQPEPQEPSLFEIFEQEAEEHLETVRGFVAEARATGAGVKLSDALRRALHTLKGSAAMAEYPGMSELAAPLERLVRAHLDLQRDADAALTSVIEAGLRRIEAGLESLRQSGAERVFDDDERDYLDEAHVLLTRLEAEVSKLGTDGESASPREIFTSENVDLLLDAAGILNDWARQGANARVAALRDELRNTADRARNAGQAGIAELASALNSAHERLGDALGPQAQPILERAHEALVGTLDALAADLEVPDVAVSVAELAAVDTALEAPAVESAPPVAATGPATEPGTGVVTEEVAESVAALDLDPEMVDIFFEEADEILEAMEGAIEGWPAGDARAADEMMRALHTLKGGARMAGLSGLGEEAHDLETWIEARRGAPDAGFFSELRERTDVMAEHVARLRRGESVVRTVVVEDGAASFEADAEETAALLEAEAIELEEAPPAVELADAEPELLQAEVAELAPEPELDAALDPAPDPEPDPEPDPAAVMADEPGTTIAEEPVTRESVTQEPVAEEPADVVADEPTDDIEDTDSEILEFFLEEAVELTEMLDGSVQGWRDQPDNEIHAESVLRALHTLKGGARMAGLMALGERAHDLETRIIERRSRGEVPDADFLGGLQGEVDALSERIAQVGGGAPAVTAAPESEPEVPEASAPAPEAPVAAAPAPVVPPTPVSSAPEPAPEVPPQVAPEAPAAPESTAEAAPAAQDGAGRQAAARGEGGKESPQEMIRVSAVLLDDLVNLAGETSIMRGRVQQQITDFSSALDELSATIERIREQVRRLDSEAQEQVLSKQEAAERAERAGYEDFDPLEMDRYTQLQELTRTLAESASDVSDLRDTLSERLRDTDTLLIQQGRINTELQEGLMRTRMVPFARLLPRLKRIVRQVGRELGKPVDLVVENAEGELDRNVLERMIAPLEHMLRNAVDHGLESPEQRAEKGKPAQGTIRLRLDREGGDILIEVSDDGGGINVAGVRAKAVERGLLAADAKVGESEILSFIMSAGFSTAKSVTQISGRGVGMDVVNSEVKQLGGSIDITSRLGEGTTFGVRLPFTVSVNRALMVTVGNDVMAVPLNGIEGIVRVSPKQLIRKYEAGEGASFSYAGREYGLSYLGEWLGDPRRVRDDVQSIPIIMVRSGDMARAVHVDAIGGSREIVVKSLGAQFAGVGGVSGATIMGDGGVVVILDLPAMLRASQASIDVEGGEPPRLIQEAVDAGPIHVMVVDDSVTVRKVTTRLLERKGYQVTVAKDGVEAVATLEEVRPDVMLLDIEMPRMDGFEVATHVRNEPTIADLPIIMITSRTGDKHRERAEAIGVNRFLGKPFQEAELLTTIEALTKA